MILNYFALSLVNLQLVSSFENRILQRHGKACMTLDIWPADWLLMHCVVAQSSRHQPFVLLKLKTQQNLASGGTSVFSAQLFSLSPSNHLIYSPDTGR